MITNGVIGRESGANDTILSGVKDHPIIIVDDSVDDRNLLLHELRTCLPEEKVIITLENGQKLLDYLKLLETSNSRCEQFEQEMPEMIFLDLLMPGMDGVEIIKSIRNQSVWRDIPITLITHSKNNQAIEKAEKAGANAFLPKPFTSFDVIKTLNKANNFAPTLM